MECSSGNDHCCWIRGQTCEFLVENVNDRRWSCGLYLELGSWTAVYIDPRYKKTIEPVVTELITVNCGDWPRSGELCHTCGKVGE